MSDSQQQHTDVGGNMPSTPPPPVAINQQQNPAQTIAQPQAIPPVPPQAMSAGSMHKEAEPLQQNIDVIPSDHTEVAPKLDQELKEAGVEQSPQVEHPQLTIEDKRAGIEAAKASVPAAQVTGSSVTFPFTEQKIEEIQKTTSWKESLRWFAEEVLREIKKTHEKLTKKDTE